MLQENPHDEFLLYALGMELLSEKNFVKAKEIFIRIVEKNPSHTDALFRLGQICQSQEQEKEAMEWYEKALSQAEKLGKTKTAMEIKSHLEILK